MDGYTAPFQITDTMIDRVIEIGKSTGRIESLGNPLADPQLQREGMIRAIHALVALEDSRLSREDVISILSAGPLDEPGKDVLRVTNARDAYFQMSGLDPYSVGDLLDTHRMLLEGVVEQTGVLRREEQGFFARLFRPAVPVSDRIVSLFQWLQNSTAHPLLKACTAHYELVHIRPFEEGSECVARFWQMLLLQEWKPYFIWMPVEWKIRERMQEYQSTLSRAVEANNATPFIEFLLDAVFRALHEIERNAEYLGEDDRPSPDFLQRPPQPQSVTAEYAFPDLVPNVPDQQSDPEIQISGNTGKPEPETKGDAPDSGKASGDTVVEAADQNGRAASDAAHPAASDGPETGTGSLSRESAEVPARDSSGAEEKTGSMETGKSTDRLASSKNPEVPLYADRAEEESPVVAGEYAFPELHSEAEVTRARDSGREYDSKRTAAMDEETRAQRMLDGIAAVGASTWIDLREVDASASESEGENQSSVRDSIDEKKDAEEVGSSETPAKGAGVVDLSETTAKDTGAVDPSGSSTKGASVEAVETAPSTRPSFPDHDPYGYDTEFMSEEDFYERTADAIDDWLDIVMTEKKEEVSDEERGSVENGDSTAESDRECGTEVPVPVTKEDTGMLDSNDDASDSPAGEAGAGLTEKEAGSQKAAEIVSESPVPEPDFEGKDSAQPGSTDDRAEPRVVGTGLTEKASEELDSNDGTQDSHTAEAGTLSEEKASGQQESTETYEPERAKTDAGRVAESQDQLSEENTAGIPGTDRDEQILALLRQDAHLTAKSLSEILNISKRQTERILARLKKEGRIERVGASKNGRWVVK